MKELNNKRGISLIVLVITIIVMIVLATAIILSLQSSGIIVKANEAKTKSDIANVKQVVAMASSEWQLMDASEQSKYSRSFKNYANEKLNKAGYLTESKYGSYEVTEDGNLYVYPKIPEGFVVSKASSEDTIEEGLVIYKTNVEVNDANVADAQKEYDQFVWVPVPNMNNFKRTDWENNRPINAEEFSGAEPYDAGYPTEVEEYNNMIASVEKYGGFFIGRYEAGDGEATVERETYTAETHAVVIKKGAVVYNYVGWGATDSDIEGDIIDSNGNNKGKGAVYLSQNMYPKNNNYTTTLVYGVQWDATLRWLSDKYDVTDSRSWGNYSDSTGDAESHSGEWQTSGYSEAWKAKNIYDLAGNYVERTMEMNSAGSGRISRGGHAGNYGELYASSWRSSRPSITTYATLGFRPVLYLK